jgi:membrane dipeptidase
MPLKFWAAYIGCDRQYNDSLHQALEQIDVIKRMVDDYPDYFEFVTTAEGNRDLPKKKTVYLVS